MQRRTFIEKSGLSLAALCLSPTLLKAWEAKTAENQTIRFEIHSDGSYTLQSPYLSIKNAFPAIDGIPVRCTKIQLEANAVTYHTVSGKIKLDFLIQNQTLAIRTTLIGYKQAPHWVQPLSHGILDQVQQIAYFGLGFGGPSGLADLSTAPYATPKRTENGGDDTWLLESYMLSQVTHKDGHALCIYAEDHKNFLYKVSYRNEEKRFGLINRHLLYEDVLIQAEFATEQIPITGDSLILPNIVFAANSSPMESLSVAAAAIATTMQVKPLKPNTYHWCSWYIKEANFSMADLKSFFNGIEKQNPKPQFQTIQIDDGYQTNYGDWLDFKKPHWPGGIAPAIKLIQSKGIRPGIWVGAFMVSKKSQVFRSNPSWILKKKDGSFFEEMSGDAVVLDTSHPGAMTYIRSVFRYMRKLGITFYKTDFMDWGFQDSVVADRYVKGKTSVQYFRETLQAIREEIGQESYLLACISPFAPFLGYADGMRVANDTPINWQDGNNVTNMLHQMYMWRFANHVFWQNDPDVMYLSPNLAHVKMTQSERISLAYFIGISGGSVNTSEWLADADSVQLWRFIAPSAQKTNAEITLTSSLQSTWIISRFYPEVKAYGVLVLNPVNEIRSMQLDFNTITKNAKKIYLWSHDKPPKDIGIEKTIEITLEPHESVLYYISDDGKEPSKKLSLGGRLWNS